VGGVDVNGIGFWARDDGVGVLAVDSLTIEDGARLWVYGSRALLVLSRNDVIIQGQIDLTAGVCPDAVTTGAHCPGPGGGFGSTSTTFPTGCGPGGDGEESGGNETGGGGGGFGTVGAQGANGPNAGEDGGTGGAVAGCPGSDLVPLMGGSGAGWGGGGNGNGGGGGGAMQITSGTRIVVEVVTPARAVGVWAGGMGGVGGGGANGGGGGGAGGGILLEAPAIDVGPGVWLAANGGGGGSGNASDALSHGALGRFDAAPASGGTTGRPGGSGGTGALPAIAGMGGGDGTGAGGGGAGIIRLNGTTTGADATNCSPMASFGSVTLE
jgi:hypothetical protein